jgi:hypothetical protein
MGCRCGRGEQALSHYGSPATLRSYENDLWLRFLERESPESLRYPMIRSEYGAKFSTPGAKSYEGIIIGAPAHHVDEQGDWVPCGDQLLIGNDGVYGLPHNSLRALPDGLAHRKLAWTPASIGVIENGRFKEIWIAEPHRIHGNTIIQNIGPVIHEILVEPWVLNDWYIIQDMPAVDGDALALEILIKGHGETGAPWAKDASGRYFNLDTMFLDGRYYKMIPLELLQSMSFPVIIDPEIYGGPECWVQRQSGSSFNDCRNGSVTSGANNLTSGRIGVNHPNASTWICARCAGKWVATTYSGTIISADVKMSCSSDPDNRNRNETLSFARADWQEYTCPALSLEFSPVKDRCRLATLGADLGTLSYYENTIGCTSPIGTYGAWFALNSGDITHLNNYYGLGDSRYLNWCLEPKNMHNGTDPAPTAGDAATLFMWLPQKGANGGPALRFNAEDVGFVWLVS